MPEMILVTISWNEYERDFEIPSSRPFSQWEESLRSVLRQAFPGILLSGRKIRHLYSGKRDTKAVGHLGWKSPKACCGVR